MDSYFGQIGHSFYGGPNGLSFSIKEVFPNKVALKEDADLKFSSSIQVGEYVIISYGNPNSDLAYYNNNKAIDAEAYNGQTFNATLWQKLVIDGTISYGDPIVTFTTSVPNFIFSSLTIAPEDYGNFYAVKIGEKSYSDPLCTEDSSFVNLALEVENYNEEYGSWEIKDVTPARYVKNTSVFETKIVEKLSSNEIDKLYEIKLSNPWDFSIGEVTPSDPGGEEPGPAVSVTNVNGIKLLNFTLPKPWDVNITKGSDLAANASPILTELTSSNTAKKWKLQLPQPWNFSIDTTDPVKPTVSPSVSLRSDDTNQYFLFHLPQPWDFGIDGITSIASTESPSVSLRSDNDNGIKYFLFALPRAEKTKYGDAMAYTTDKTININDTTTAADWAAISELAVGDFYINTTYAGVHKITAKTSSSATTKYLGSMLLAIPNILGNAVNPYDANGNPVVPTVATSAVGPVSSWNVSVDIIRAPVFRKSANSGFVASTAQGVISSEAANDGITYTIKVPKGTKITTPLEQPDIALVAKVDGDLYLDNDGLFRRYSANYDQWLLTVNIKGNSFLIKNATVIVITAANLIDYSGTLYLKMGLYVVDNYPASYSTNLRANEILNIDYLPELNVSSSHWLYKSNGEWTGSKLTGDVSNTIVENIWQDDPEDNRAYSVTRINELRTTISILLTKIAAIEAAIEAAWGELPIIE